MNGFISILSLRELALTGKRNMNTAEQNGPFDRTRLKDLPEAPGIYIMHNTAGDIIYVGKAVNLKNRVRQYFQNSKNLSVKTNALVSHIADIETIVVENEVEALILECSLIKKNHPKYNICLKDGKTYPYIAVTLDEAYPRVLSTRERKRGGTRYFGPFTSAFAVKKTIEAIAKRYPIRLCTRKTAFGKTCGRPCLNYHIGQCCAPCTGKVDPAEYKKNIDEILQILEGHEGELLNSLEERMKEASLALDFETAADLRDQIFGIKHIAEKQKIILNGGHDQDIIALYKDRDLACIQVLNIRAGQLVGRDHTYTEDVLEEKEQDILTAFTQQYYMDRAYIPKEIIFAAELDLKDREPIADMLSSSRGSKVTLTFPKRGHKNKLAEMAEENAKLALEQYEAQKMRKTELEASRTEALQKFLSLQEPPARIEAYDISNIGGTNNVGGMVVFQNGSPDKKAYRRFRIKSVDGQDDYASMQEMLFRRIERGMKELEAGKEKGGFLPFPEVFAIDGGKTHVHAVEQILSMYPALQVKVIGLVKDDHHRIRGIIYNGEEFPLKYAEPLSRYLSDVSEEVHRYAISYHRTLRRKDMLESSLQEIPGIGKKRRETLMRHFGTLKNIKEAAPEEIAALPGMSEKTAQAVKQYFEEEKS